MKNDCGVKKTRHPELGSGSFVTVVERSISTTLNGLLLSLEIS